MASEDVRAMNANVMALPWRASERARLERVGAPSPGLADIPQESAHAMNITYILSIIPHFEQ